VSFTCNLNCEINKSNNQRLSSYTGSLNRYNLDHLIPESICCIFREQFNCFCDHVYFFLFPVFICGTLQLITFDKQNEHFKRQLNTHLFGYHGALCLRILTYLFTYVTTTLSRPLKIELLISVKSKSTCRCHIVTVSSPMYKCHWAISAVWMIAIFHSIL